VNTQNSIPDVFLIDVEREDGRLILLRDNDHLLRRFGQVEFRELRAGENTSFTLRAVADEIWSVIKGEVSLSLIDRRDCSPTKNHVMELTLSGEEPQSVLVPFGIAFAFTAIEDAQMVRLATHHDQAHSQDETLSYEEFASLLKST
jgi:hypothetical protein